MWFFKEQRKKYSYILDKIHNSLNTFTFDDSDEKKIDYRIIRRKN